MTHQRKPPKDLAEYAIERKARRQERICEKIKSAEEQLDEMVRVARETLKHPFYENAPEDVREAIVGLRDAMVKASSNLELAKRLIQQVE